MTFSDKRILFYGFATSNYAFREVMRVLLGRGHRREDIGVIFPNGQYRRFYDDILPQENVFYLYAEYNTTLRQVRIDGNLSVVQQDFADNPFAMLAADKVGFRKLPARRQIENLETIYRIYDRFLERFKPDYVVFPDIEVVDGYLLCVMAKARGIPVAYPFHLRNLGRSIIGSNIREKFPPYFGQETENGRAGAAQFKALYEKEPTKATFFNPDWHADNNARIPAMIRNPFARLLRAIGLRLTCERHYIGEDTFYLKFLVFILPLLEAWRAFKYKHFMLPFMAVRSAGDLPDKFYLYALQVTPESSINYLSPLYIDQIRAIDEVRQAMPPGTWLVVKEHPGMRGVRGRAFYRDLHKMPGVLLADASIPMEQFMDKCSAIFTITGTVGLECLLAKKPCYMFGENYFAHYLPNKKSFPDVKTFTGQNLDALMADKYEAFMADLAKIFSISHGFLLVDALSNPAVMMEANIHTLAQALEDHYQKITARQLTGKPDRSV